MGWFEYFLPVSRVYTITVTKKYPVSRASADGNIMKEIRVE